MNKKTVDIFAKDEKHREQSNGWNLGWLSALASGGVILVTAMLFGAGQSFYANYVFQLGIDRAQVPLNFYEAMVWGFKRAQLPGYWTYILLGGCIIVLVVNRYRDSIATRLNRYPWVLNIQSFIKAALQGSVGASGVLVMLIVIAVALGNRALVFFSDTGEKSGKDLMNGLEEDPDAQAKRERMQWIEITFKVSEHKDDRGYRLFCTEQLCLIYNPGPERKGHRLVSLEGMQEIRVFRERPRTTPVQSHHEVPLPAG